MFSTTDTIVAIATPPGRGGIGVVRLSGGDASSIAHRLVTYPRELQPRRATFTKVRHHDAIDQAIATYFPAPHSYTGEDVVEISAHGSPVVLRLIVNAAIDAGARLAERGEFTLRAFLNRRIDLTQAEAVADLIDAATPLQARAAFDQLEGTLTSTIAEIDAALFDLIARLEASVDFPEEGYHFVEPDALAIAIDALVEKTANLLVHGRRGRLIRDGLQVAIVGRPNVGKSSLFNALVGASRAIVTDVPGTTRDLVTEVVDLEGLRVTLVDTAGLREASDAIEAEGVMRSMQSARVADLVLQVVVDDEPQALDSKQLVVRNKSDLGPPLTCASDPLSVSAKTGDGLDELRRQIVDMLARQNGAGHAAGDDVRDRPEITNVRHIALVQRAHDALRRARQAALADGGALSEEFVLADLQDARDALEEITGRRGAEDVLAHIFERFCIGK